MRVFFGIELSDELRSGLAAARDIVTSIDTSWADEKWVRADNLHVTVAFIGEIDPGAPRELADGVARIGSEHPPFRMRLVEPVAPVPGPGRASMLWTALEDGTGACERLAGELDRMAVRYATDTRRRPFTPHITLCRARRPHPLHAAADASRELAAELERRGVDMVVSVPAVTVFASTLRRTGPVYEELARIPLG